MFRLVRFLKPYKRQAVVGPVFKLIEAILELFIPILMAMLIDNGVKNHDSAYVSKIGIFMILIVIVGAASAFVCQYNAAIVSQGVGTDLRNSLFEKIGTFSFNEIDKLGTPSLINRITSDVNQLQFAVAMLIRLVIRVPFLCIGGMIMAMTINLKLSIILFVTIPIFILVLYIIMSKTIPLYKLVQGKLDKLGTVIRENLSGVRVIRAFARMESEKIRFEKHNKEYADTSIKVGKISALFNPITSVIINLSIAVVLWFGGIQVNFGAMTQGEVIAYINYINMILSALIVVASLVITFTKAAASAARVNEVFDTEATIVDIEVKVEAIHSDKNTIIAFENVSFSYEGAAEYTLKNLSFSISKGETVGIIGSTGSGKTSLISLIPRFYDASEGNVYVNGVNVKEQSQSQLKSSIGMVLQKAVLFTGTVAENIRWGLEAASDEDIIKAAKIAQAHDFITKLSEGYNTKISQGGINLSGGQKQRLTIARALVKQPEILILDDSFSALDYATDAALRRELRENTRDMTIIMVTQRVTTIKNADKIIVLDDGEIVGIGSNEELLKSCKVYREIYDSQENSEVK